MQPSWTIPTILALSAALTFPVVAEELASPPAAEPSANTAEDTAGPPSPTQQTGEEPDAKPWAPAVNPKPLSENVKRGLTWLAEHQQQDGGWGQGEESNQMRQRNGQEDEQRDKSNVADTCIATLALIRAGSTPSQGPHQNHIVRAVAFVCGQVEASDPSSLHVTDVRGTRVQQKLGEHVDTFLAALLLAEVKDQMPSDDGNKRVGEALAKITEKIQKNQQDDGTWGRGGWAGSLQGAIGVKALNRAAQAGAPVAADALERAEASSRQQAQVTAEGKFKDDGRSAGVELYAGASAVGGLQDAANTNVQERRRVETEALALRQQVAQAEQRLAARPARAPEAEALQAEIKQGRANLEQLGRRIDRFDATDKDLAKAKEAIVQRLGDEQFVAGFGSNGGEEFLSYMNIGETLVVDGGEAWEKFDKEMTQNLSRVQNEDGSWTGHHCITGRTFCTSAALLVLTVDRAPVPVAAKVKQR